MQGSMYPIFRWVLGNSDFNTGFGQVYDYEVIGPLGLQLAKFSPGQCYNRKSGRRPLANVGFSGWQ